MTPEDFAKAALRQPEAIQGGHMGAMDFRVRKKIFGTYDPKTELAALKLMPEQQDVLMAVSDAFYPANGVWGTRGWTKIRLAKAKFDDVAGGLAMAWRNAAPKTLILSREKD
jgi:hypothetical protein